MSEPIDLPRVSDDRIEPLPRTVCDIPPGERVILTVIVNLSVDEEGHVWVDASSKVMPGEVNAGLALQAERTEAGFILWLDKKVKFFHRRHQHKNYLPVVEFREQPEGRA